MSRIVRNVHLIRGNFRYVNLKNNENVLRSENIGGVVQTVIYGSRQIYRQRAVNAGLEYEFDWKADRYNPVMSLRAGADYYNRSGSLRWFSVPVRSMSRMYGCISVPTAISGSDAGG
ncbi:MAG: hypothetical protein ACLUEV_03040 [Alistipes sp.]